MTSKRGREPPPRRKRRRAYGVVTHVDPLGTPLAASSGRETKVEGREKGDYLLRRDKKVACDQKDRRYGWRESRFPPG